MDIVRSTFEQDGRNDFIEMLDNNDTRVIRLFAKYGIAFSDEVVNLLDLEMSLKFKEDTEIIQKEYPDFKETKDKIIKNLASESEDFEFEIIVELFDFSQRKECKVKKEVLRCWHYYISFYTDLPDFEPYPEESSKIIIESESVSNEIIKEGNIETD